MTSLNKLPAGVQGEVFTRKSRSISVRFANSQFEDISNNTLSNTTLRVVKDGRMSIANSSEPGGEDLLLQNALDTLPFGSPVNYALPGAAKLADIPLVDEELQNVDVQTMVDIARDLTESLLRFNPRILVRAGVRLSQTEVNLQNSAGFTGSYQLTSWGASLGGRLIDGNDFLSVGEGRSGSSLITDFEDVKAEVIKGFQLASTNVPLEAGTYPVIFAPAQIGHLTRPLLACLNGKAFVRNISPLKGRMGQQLLDSRITLVDDGTLPMMATSRPFDREGIPTRRNVLIEAGVAKQLLLDLQSAHDLKLESTGNGSGNGPAPNRILLLPGEKALDEMVKGIDRGLLVFDTMGAWTGNPYSGNVTGTVSLGLKIEKGEIVGRVKNCMFSLNSFRHFKDSLIDISSETKDAGGATYPYVALADVVIATK